jgi:hypothetical protein
VTIPAGSDEPEEYRTFVDDDSPMDEDVPDPFATPPTDPRSGK